MLKKIRFQPIKDIFMDNYIGFESTVCGENGESASQLFDFFVGELASFDQWAIRESLNRGLPFLKSDQKLFINIHSETLEHGGDLIPDVDPNKVIIELSEVTEITSSVRHSLQNLSNRGFQFAIDDFGVRCSNINRLTLDWFKPSWIKLDRTIIEHVDINPRVETIVKYTLDMCAELGIEVVAEGVETHNQLLKLMQIGVRFAQGYYLGRPEDPRIITNLNRLQGTHTC
ncbi:EAL domain-containing protein [Paenibacillus sp. LMG 31459]|uniref:EAL domain-containing protein n=1 Tax=Paenibacillus phytohabitans TaxID=2654978 RepID=A0ABX1YN81_9BACL|nr:EAL domain-containing protein [Paenibacillus phytohabitans]NOU82515.1 EAL domain-containing protein [Paenibacillus phytohabitans]